MYKDQIEKQQFLLIYNIILDRIIKTFETELNDNSDIIYITNVMDRTVLNWITTLTQLSNMRLLIDHDSLLNTMDFSGRTTILYVVDSYNDEALRIILEIDTNPNLKVSKDLFRSSPLTTTSFNDLIKMIKLFIEFDINIDIYNLENRITLHKIINIQNVEYTNILFTYNVNSNYILSNEYLSFTTTIIYNNYVILKFFINKYFINN